MLDLLKNCSFQYILGYFSNLHNLLTFLSRSAGFEPQTFYFPSSLKPCILYPVLPCNGLSTGTLQCLRRIIFLRIFCSIFVCRCICRSLPGTVS